MQAAQLPTDTVRFGSDHHHHHSADCGCGEHHDHANQTLLGRVTDWFKRLFNSIITDLKAVWARLTGKAA